MGLKACSAPRFSLARCGCGAAVSVPYQRSAAPYKRRAPRLGAHTASRAVHHEGSLRDSGIGCACVISIVQNPPKCNCQCDFLYKPVCAVDSKGIEETYPSECSFECYKCAHSKTDLTIKYRGECRNTSPGKPPNRSEKQKTATGQLNAQNTSPTKCNCRCQNNYAPLCAVDRNGVSETYPNQCAFECYKCTHGKDLRVRSQGECPNPPPKPTPGTVQKPGPNGRCNCKCTFEYAPVCAGDSKGVKETYPTACAFECYKCTHGKRDLRIINQGECSEQPTPNRPSQNQTGKCNCQCPLNYNPVCAADLRGKEETYPNACALDCYKCTHRKLRIVKQGECSNKATARPPRPGPPNRSRTTIGNKNCDCVCQAVYLPVCAVNSKGAERTFSNRCKLKCENCQNDEDFVARRDGECDSGSSRTLPRSKTRTA